MTIRNMIAALTICLIPCVAGSQAVVQPKAQSGVRSKAVPLSERVADEAMQRWPEGNLNEDHSPQVWQYQEGTLLQGMTATWRRSGNEKYYEYIRQAVNHVVDKDGKIVSYSIAEHSLDQVLMGRQVMMLYEITGESRYLKAAQTLRAQLAEQPRTTAGGFWHKQIYPSQMWLDSLYMGEPFYAAYAKKFQEPQDFDDIAQQFIVMEQHARDARTGLLYHGWDESKQQKWADPQTGLSSQFWSRAMGWYAMGLLDTLEIFPAKHPKRAELIAILKRLASPLAKYQDPKTGVWYQIMDKPNENGNYRESSASSMFVYVFAKGARLGYLPEKYKKAAKKGWDGIQKEFVETDTSGNLHITHIVKGVGLGGKPYRDGSYAYYIGEKVVSDEPKGIGAFLLAASEVESAASNK